MNKPFITIPLPSAKDNHQMDNARFYENKGCCWVINQNDLTEEMFTNLLIKIVQDDSEYNDKINNLKNKIKILREEKNKLANNFTEERKIKINEFFKIIDKVLREYVENNSIDLVLNKKDILIGKNNYNITDDILKIVNELK